MPRKSKLRKILESDYRTEVLPDGNINPNQGFGKQFFYCTRAGTKKIWLDDCRLDEYIYRPTEGLIVPHNRLIAEAMVQAALKSKAQVEVDILPDYKKVFKSFKIEKDENRRLKYVSNNYRQGGGGEMFIEGRYAPTIGKFYNKLGGMRYTYGLEIETTAGALTYGDLVASNTSMQGDRTIDAFEYVTNILSGNEGLDKVKILANAISRRTIIGERNGLHIHIGGIKDEASIWNPTFNRLFSINAIKLGVQIEDEMMGLLYPDRRGDRYLKSIKEWGNINAENWREILGDYVFRGSDDIFRAYNHYETHSLDEVHNTSFKISRWAKTKHKWLNLNHCNAASHVNTIEFRLYSATGNFKKIHNFLLLSLAIVWFIEHRQRLIWDGGVTLYTLVQEAYDKRGYSILAAQLHEFINKRKLEFKIIDEIN